MISLSVPVYKEREALLALFEKVQRVMRAHYGDDWEIVFVNDGSHDGSEKLLDELAAKNPEVKVVHFRRNFGQTAAMMAGFDFARGHTIIPLDGDGQKTPNKIFLALLPSSMRASKSAPGGERIGKTTRFNATSRVFLPINSSPLSLAWNSMILVAR